MATKEQLAGGSGEGRSPLEELRSLQIERQPVRSAESHGDRPRARSPWAWIITIAVVVAGYLLLRGPIERWYAEQTAPTLQTALVVKTGGQPVVLTASGYVNADAVVVVGATISG